MTENASAFGMLSALTGLKERGYLPHTIYDIGAADGEWARMANSIWPDAKLFCFEPLPSWRKILNKVKLDINGKATVIYSGVGDVDEVMRMGVTQDLYGSSFAYSGCSEIDLPIRRLDSLLAEGSITKPSLIKLDVQGFERRVLDGGQSALESAEILLMECQFFPFCAEMRTLDQTIGYVSSLGFVPYEFVDFLRRPLDGAMGQCDLIFVRQGHRLISDNRWSA